VGTKLLENMMVSIHVKAARVSSKEQFEKNCHTLAVKIKIVW
jgi:hypothetical protein